MPIDELIDRIMSDARSEAERLVAQAHEKGDNVQSEAEREAEEKYNQIVDAARRSAEEEKNQKVTMANLDARKAILEEKQQIIAEVFDRALDALRELPREQYVQMLVSQLVQVAGDGGGELVLSPADRERVGEEVVKLANESLGGEARLVLSEETRDIAGGFVLLAGGVEINDSLESQVNSTREELEPRIVEILFEDNGQES